jgi:hypothetical protein
MDPYKERQNKIQAMDMKCFNSMPIEVQQEGIQLEMKSLDKTMESKTF